MWFSYFAILFSQICAKRLESMPTVRFRGVNGKSARPKRVTSTRRSSRGQPDWRAQPRHQRDEVAYTLYLLPS